MIAGKNMRFILVTVWVLSIFGCLSDQDAAITSETSPSRYDLITSSKVYPETDNYPPILHVDGWKKPYPVKGAINSAGLEDSPFITTDGKTMFFFYTPSPEIPAEKQIGDQVTGIYTAKISGEIWQEPERIVLTEKDQIALDGCPFFNGDMLWFCSIREGNFRDIDIWTAEWNGSEWVNITNAGEYLNQELQIGEMHIRKDGSSLIYHKPNIEQDNRYDLWEIQKSENGWNVPRKLDALNSSDDDSRPALTSDGHELWFTRTYNGTPAIFRSQWVDGNWDEPKLIISQFAGEPSIDNKGNIYFTHHFFQEGKMKEADIYIAEKE